MSNDSKVNQWFQLCVGNWLVSGPGSCSMEKKQAVFVIIVGVCACGRDGGGGGGGGGMAYEARLCRARFAFSYTK